MSRVVREDLKLTTSLRETARRYMELKKDRAETAVKLYETFLKNYIFNLEGDKQKVADFLKRFFGKDKIRMVSIDGTKYQKSRRGCLVFYVLAAPLVYELNLNSPKLRAVRIEEETVKNNVMVLVPVPLSEIFLLSEETAPTEEGEEVKEELGDVFSPQKIGKIDNVLMKLAEVYTAYWSLKNINPDVIMLDGSLFQDYSFSNRSVERLSIYKGEVLGRKFSKDDFVLFKSFPINAKLGIPSVSFTREFVTAEILTGGKIELDKDLTFKSRLTGKDVTITKRQLKNMQNFDYFEIKKYDDKITIKLKDSYKNSWNRLKDFFLTVCREGFGKNNLDAFRVYITEDGERRFYRYFCEEDVETLCRIGYDMLIEECWKSQTLLFSVTKDSFVRFYVDNFLTIGGTRHLKMFNFNQELLPRVPSTDAGMIYDISIQVNNLNTPIALMEYDPAISTIYSFYDSDSKEYTLKQLRRVAQERLFLRSLIQLSEDKVTGRKSYVYTVDRITYPKLDNNLKRMKVQMGNKTYEFAYYDQPSDTLKAIVGLMYLLSSNRHDAVFGYPDPLFDVDQYVKTLGKTHRETLDLALTEIDLDEFSVTYRQMRERGGG